MKNFAFLSKYNYILLIFFPVLLFTSFKERSESETSSTVIAVDSTGYQTVWSDEFNGSIVDTANWNFETGGKIAAMI